jgi:hypothetical protein
MSEKAAQAVQCLPARGWRWEGRGRARNPAPRWSPTLAGCHFLRGFKTVTHAREWPVSRRNRSLKPLSPGVDIKQFGIGLAAGIILDACGVSKLAARPEIGDLQAGR